MDGHQSGHPAGRPPALRAVMRPAPTRTRRASEAVTAAATPAPLRSTPSASSRETRRHFVPSRSLLGRSRRSAPLPSSRVRRTCHGPCFVLAALGHVPRQVLRGRRCRTASTRQRAFHPRRCAARPIPVPTPASAAVTQAAKRCRWCERGCRGRQLVRQRLRLFPRATVVDHANGHRPLPQDPRVAHGTCLKPSSAPTPHAERRADAACSFRCPLPPSPAAPTQTTPAKLSWSVLHAPALSRLPCGTCTAPSVGAGWLPGQPRSGFRGVALGATSSSL